MEKIIECKKDIAVIGAGHWGKNHIRILYDKQRLHTICDVIPYDLAKEKVPDNVAYGPLNDVLGNRQIRAVVIATPPATHGEIAVQCLAAGKHVLIEKPVTTTSLTAEFIQAAEKASGMIVMVGHLLRYHNAFLEMSRLVEEEYLGKLRYIYANRLNLGKVREKESVWWTFAPHDISMILALVKGEEPEVWGKQWKRSRERPAESTVTFLKFPGGVEAHIFVSWLHPIKRHEMVCLCERGMIVFNDCAPWEKKIEVFEMIKEEAVERKDFKQGFEKVEEHEPLKAELEHFLECVNEKEKFPNRNIKPETGIDEGIRVIRILEQAQQSMEAKDGK